MSLVDNFIIALDDVNRHYGRPDLSFIRYSNAMLDETHSIVDRNLVKKLASNHFNLFSSLKNHSVDSGLIPPGLKMVGSNYLVFERPPTIKNIFYVPLHKSDVPSNTEGSQQIYSLPIPWQLYFVCFNPDMYTYSVHMFFMNTSINTSDQKLYLPPLPNFYTFSMLCPPVMETMEDVDRYPKNISGVMQAAYDWVWNSGTNHDLTEACLHVSFQCPKENSIMKHIDDHVYAVYFDKMRSLANSRHSAPPHYISHMFSSWEKCTLNEVCNFVWPNTSHPLSNFTYSSYDITETDAYQDNLVSYLDNGDYDMDEIQDIIENDSYDHDDYINYLISSDCINQEDRFNSLSSSWRHTFTYEEFIPHLIRHIDQQLSRAQHSFKHTLNTFNQARLETSA